VAVFDATGGGVVPEKRKSPNRDPTAVLGAIARDSARLAGQHADLLRRELREGLGESGVALATMATGAGLVAVGGVLGSLMLVHGLHRASRVPLWGCYGLVGGLLATAGVGLVGAGGRRVANIDLLPRETIAALRDDFQWITGQDETRTS